MCERQVPPRGAKSLTGRPLHTNKFRTVRVLHRAEQKSCCGFCGGLLRRELQESQKVETNVENLG